MTKTMLDIREVKSLNSANEVNEYLAIGWVLIGLSSLSAGDMTNGVTHQVGGTEFIVGRFDVDPYANIHEDPQDMIERKTRDNTPYIKKTKSIKMQWVNDIDTRLSHVYLLYGNDCKLFKIGYSKNLLSRVQAIMYERREIIDLVAIIPSDNPEQLEEKLHAVFRHQRTTTRGEWFDMDSDDIDLFINYHPEISIYKEMS